MIIVILLLVQMFLTWLSLLRDFMASGVSTMDIIGMPFLVMSWAVLASIFYILSEKGKIFSFIFGFAFYVVSIFNIGLLLFILIQSLIYGPLMESGLIFIVFPLTGFCLFFGGILLGLIVYKIKGKIKFNKKKFIK